jgi:hypothetical protein
MDEGMDQDVVTKAEPGLETPSICGKGAPAPHTTEQGLCKVLSKSCGSHVWCLTLLSVDNSGLHG